jgi:hypothetical protein
VQQRLHVLVVTAPGSGGALGGAAASHAAGSALAVGGVHGQIDVLLGVSANQEGRNVNHLLSNSAEESFYRQS